MLFNQLSSETIKAGVVSKIAFSLGFKLIGAMLAAEKFKVDNAHLRVSVDFETGQLDVSKLEKAETAKRVWAEFTDWAETHDYVISPIEEIAQAYVNSSGKPVVKASDEIIAMRAKLSGVSEKLLKQRADKATEQAQGKAEEQVKAILAELVDIKEYRNEWYNNDKVSQWGTLVHSSVDIEQIVTDEIVENYYAAVLKSQIAYWTRYNNWDDAELVLIAADKELLS